MKLLYIIWNKYLEHLWNWIPSNIQALFYSRKRGIRILRELRSLSPNVLEISKEMVIRKFEWRHDPIDFHQKPWVTCDKGAGDCDDWAYLWKELLKNHGNTKLLFTRSKGGSAHLMAIFMMDGSAWLLSNLKVLDKAEEDQISQFDTKFYGGETAYSFYI